MCKVLMSIKPEYVESILSGIKKFEYRKTNCKKNVDSILIYSTYPVMRVVAEAKVNSVVEGSPEDVWKKTQQWAGIDKSFFDTYYNGREIAYAFCLGTIKKFKKPKLLSDYNISTPPQSFRYI